MEEMTDDLYALVDSDSIDGDEVNGVVLNTDMVIDSGVITLGTTV